MLDEFYYYYLSCLWSLTPIKLHAMVDYYGGPKAFFEAGESDYEGFPKRTVQTILRTKQDPALYSNWELLLKQESRGSSIRFIPSNCAEYPEILLKLPDYPYGIYVEGNLPSECMTSHMPLIAMVGARNCTTYGKELAYQFAEALSRNGCGIISGLANGIDGASHRGALDSQGYTLGILGSGIHRIYPKENYKLYLAMRERGGILSEYPPDLKPYAHLFPRRNRLISMLSDYILVIEAREKSGSLITVDFALEQGKMVGAVPGRPCDLLSEGCNQLIRQGASCVLKPEDVLEEFMDCTATDKVLNSSGQVNLSLGLAPDEKKVYSVLRLEPMYVDDIICNTDFPIWKTISILSELEIKGVIRQEPHQFYYRIQL